MITTRLNRQLSPTISSKELAADLFLKLFSSDIHFAEKEKRETVPPVAVCRQYTTKRQDGGRKSDWKSWTNTQVTNNNGNNNKTDIHHMTRYNSKLWSFFRSLVNQIKQNSFSLHFCCCKTKSGTTNTKIGAVTTHKYATNNNIVEKYIKKSVENKQGKNIFFCFSSLNSLYFCFFPEEFLTIKNARRRLEGKEEKLKSEKHPLRTSPSNEWFRIMYTLTATAAKKTRAFLICA